MRSVLAWGAQKVCRIQHELLSKTANGCINLMGYPASLTSLIENNADGFSQEMLKAPESISHCEITKWELLCSRANVIAHAQQQHQRVSDKPYLKGLVTQVELPKQTFEIQQIDSVTASKAPLELYSSLDEMILGVRPVFVEQVTDEALNRFLSDEGVYIYHREPDSLRFYQYLWDGKLFWGNEDASHRFSASRYLANKLDRKIEVSGKLILEGLNPLVVKQLTDEYAILMLPAEHALTHGLYDAVVKSGYEAVYFTVRPEAYTLQKYVALFFPKCFARSVQVAEVLVDAGACDLGVHWLDVLGYQQANLERFGATTLFEEQCEQVFQERLEDLKKLKDRFTRPWLFARAG